MGWQHVRSRGTVPEAMAKQDKEAGKRLLALRARKGWSREDLAYKAGVSNKTIERIEKGQVEGRRGTIRSLANALEVDEYAILGEPPSPLGVPLAHHLDDVRNEFRDDVACMRHQLDSIEADVRSLVEMFRAVSELRADGNAGPPAFPAPPGGEAPPVQGQRPEPRTSGRERRQSPDRRRKSA